MSFDPYGELPQGTVVLEASAGTGKTWTIATLATRFVAEGRAELAELMLVTFGRAATQELRERTRERMVAVTAGLAGTDPPDPADELVTRLAATDRAGSLARLRKALSDFDAATIATTHSFCQRMLDGLGVAGEREPTVGLVEEVDDLTVEVADDLYLQRYAGLFRPPIGPADARAVALQAVRDRQARLAPDDAPDDSPAGHRVALARAARAEVERRKRRTGLRDFDDLLSLLRDVLADPERGPLAVQRIRERYRVVLVDEFQDTDPVQWEVLRRAFHGATTLILIGDPKQAVYAFRGAEVRSYLDAVELAGAPQTLARNWRSDAALVTALDQVYGGAALGHPRIVVRPVAAEHERPRLTGSPPLRVRQVLREGRLSRGFPWVSALRERVAGDVADDLTRLFTGPARLQTASGERPVRPGDVAVLVRAGTQSAFVRDALDAVGVPWVLGSASSVFETPSAADWLRVLQALEQPHRAGRVRLAALTPLLGVTLDRLTGDDELLVEVGLHLREWSGLFGRAGFAAVFERLAAWSRLDARLLATTGGERRLTDLRHLAQLLDRAAVEQGLGLTAVAGWLAERIADPGLAAAAERSRRLDSDAAAVQVMTVHASKGLEFPVVYVPFGWDGSRAPDPASLLLHTDAGERVRDIGGSQAPGYAERKARHDAEEAGEELRLLYVALTRARSQAVVWWAPSARTAAAPLHRLLFGRALADGVVPTEPAPSALVPQDSVATARLSTWAARSGISHEIVGAPERLRWAGAVRTGGELAVARFDRVLDEAWRRTSYTALTAAAHDVGHAGAHGVPVPPGVSSEAERPGKEDEPVDDESAELVDDDRTGPVGPAAPPVVPVLATRAALRSAFVDLPAGAAFGTLVHEVLEAVDTDAPDLAAAVRRACHRAVGTGGGPVDPEALATALWPVLQTPLGVHPERTLAQISTRDRLAELDFELPVAGGDAVHGAVTVPAIAALLRAGLPTADPLAGYADRLAGLDAADLRGYLTGSIDAVLRLPGPRFVVVDYKTNRLADGAVSAHDFGPTQLAGEMIRQHYPLQALLYSVALHRYLRWRLPGYDAEQHLGGVRYLFVRGMVGPDTPPGCGVFAWQPPARLITGLSDLLAAVPGASVGSSTRPQLAPGAAALPGARS